MYNEVMIDSNSRTAIFHEIIEHADIGERFFLFVFHLSKNNGAL